LKKNTLPSQNNCHFNVFFFSKLNNCFRTISTQHYIYYFFPLLYSYLLNLIQLNNSTITTTNKYILVNGTNFTIKINTINHFLKKYAQTLNVYYFEIDRVRSKIIFKNIYNWRIYFFSIDRYNRAWLCYKNRHLISMWIIIIQLRLLSLLPKKFGEKINVMHANYILTRIPFFVLLWTKINDIYLYH